MKLVELYKDKVIGAIKGLDRIRFRGTLRWLANEVGLRTFLSGRSILLKDFKFWAESLTSSIRESCHEHAERLGITVKYLRSSRVDKEKLAREIAQERGIDVGPICLFSVVEQCIAPSVKGNRSSKRLELNMVPRKCVWLYHYFNHADYGFGHVRLQSWIPFNIFICLNGRHWLERQLIKNDIGYTKDGNCFPLLEDVAAAQMLMDSQLEMNWSDMLNGLVFDMCPDFHGLLPLRPEYYWSADETEWSSDIMFKSQSELDRLYPLLVYHAMCVSDSPSVMRYMGRRNISLSGKVKGRSPHEVMTDCRCRHEGVRVKHWVNHNSVKMYNKSGSILRIETTINNTRDFKVFRHPDDDESRPASWQHMRKGVCDLHRRCVVSDQCNERYVDALAACQVDQKLKEVASPACNKVTKKGKRYRGLNPWQMEDFKLLTFLAKGEHAIRGFRNRALRRWLYPDAEKLTKDQQRRYSARTTRRIKLLRVHGLVKKIAKENRYVLTAKGQKLACALMTASAVDIKELTEMAA